MTELKIILAGACAVAVMTACATPQTNPHYKYSSKMPAETQDVDYSGAPQQAPVTYQAAHTVPANTEPYYSRTASYPQTAPAPIVIEDLNGDPITAPAQAETVSETKVYAEPVMVETGGQNAAQSDGYAYNSGGYVTQAAATAPAAQTTQRLYDVPAQAVMPAPAKPAGMTYIVQEGDTAWSLSRKSCSSLSDLKTINNLEGDFLIKAGEAILLPASNC